MRALLKVGYRCNHACAFCHAVDRRREEAPSSEIEARIDRAARLGHTLVALSGGEVTLRPELPAWAARVASRGMDFGLVTNGSLLDARLVESLSRHRLRYVHLSLHGGTAELHDRLVGAPAFDRVLGALRALRGRGAEVWVNCVVTALNLGDLVGVLDVVRAFPGTGVKFSFLEPRGGGARGFDALAPSVSQAAARVREALAAARTGSPAVPAAHDGFPLCLLPGFEDQRGDLRSHGFWTMAEVGEPDLFPVDGASAVKPPRCADCALRGRCPGLFQGYLERRGDSELQPVAGGERSNSFTYALQARLSPGASGCPVRALGVRPWDKGRHLFVRNGGRLALFRADTRDFCDEDVARVKARGQVYLDASGKDAPDDFARQLVPLRRSAECVGCPEREGCAGLFEPREESTFARDDARVRAILRSLEGDVLDVGSGEGPYGDALENAAAGGRIRYTAVEPNPARAAALSKRWPWAKAVVARAEDLRLEPASLDHALVLRSWNHLADPAAVVRRLADALRADGTLTVVDNEPFGLVRTRGQAERAERSAARFEHRRNDGAEEAHAALGAAGALEALELVERSDVGPETSDQWLLRYAARPRGRS
jgi:MoaA/NifB/PqqE/SkfB family radical SAM enzyme/SAM-dependent methyltransferase